MLNIFLTFNIFKRHHLISLTLNIFNKCGRECLVIQKNTFICPVNMNRLTFTAFLITMYWWVFSSS